MIRARLDEHLVCVCDRCGFETMIHNSHAKPHYVDLCANCRAKPMKELLTAQGLKCYSWDGDYDLEDNPMQNGRLYLPGRRLCGYKDCVRRTHIEGITYKGEVTTEATFAAKRRIR